jgi:hypothetical protein
MRKLFVMFILIGFCPAHAESYYTILKNQFNAADGKIVEADIDVIGDPEAKTCVESNETAPNDQHLVHIRRFTVIEQGRGPLLPDTKEVRVIYSEVVEPNLSGYFDYVRTTFSRSEIKSVQTTPSNFELTVRKKNEFLFFKKSETVNPSATARVTKYGYCFNP